MLKEKERERIPFILRDKLQQACFGGSLNQPVASPAFIDPDQENVPVP